MRRPLLHAVFLVLFCGCTCHTPPTIYALNQSGKDVTVKVVHPGGVIESGIISTGRSTPSYHVNEGHVTVTFTVDTLKYSKTVTAEIGEQTGVWLQEDFSIHDQMAGQCK